MGLKEEWKDLAYSITFILYILSSGYLHQPYPQCGTSKFHFSLILHHDVFVAKLSFEKNDTNFIQIEEQINSIVF